MKIKAYSFFFITFIAIILFSCKSTPVVFDESVPLEKSATVKISADFVLTAYNGNPVKYQDHLRDLPI
jgi:hypothetical protein